MIRHGHQPQVSLWFFIVRSVLLVVDLLSDIIDFDIKNVSLRGQNRSAIR
jgi:hypothetical protein